VQDPERIHVTGLVEAFLATLAPLLRRPQPQAWLQMRGLPVGLADALDVSLVEPFRTWAALSPLVDVVPSAVLRVGWRS
jgi:hypothetical protein